ncbi:MAG: B12-binding domain-containing radical SAM protein [Ignavibacteriae bacterium]|nr:B12-binding domain-containing radical SAM protein [Ignavibacteriota bacterium]
MLIYLTYLQINSYYVHGYNYGLGYIASVLKSNGFNVKYFSIWNLSDIENFYSGINLDKPEVIGFSATSSQFPYLKEISKNIKSFSNSYLICGGAHTTLQPESINQIPELDAIAVGEGEYAMLDLANAIQNKSDFTQIKNLWVRKGNEIVKNPVRPLVENLNLLPFPDKETLDYQKILDISKGNNRFIFSRGCTFKCSYCSNSALSSVYPNKNKYYRFMEPELAIEQIRNDHEKYKFKFITFDDDTISLNKKWFFTFFELYKKNFNYPFRCNLRIETVDEDVVKLLKEAGARNIGIGLEHGNEEFRRKVLNRKMSNEQIKHVFSLVNKYEISHDDFIMVGFPEENRKLFFDTVKLSREVGAKGKPSIFQPYPSTNLANICETNNWMPNKEVYKERYEAVIDFPEFKKEDIQLSSEVFQFLIKYNFLPLFNVTIYLRILLYFSKVQNSTIHFAKQIRNKMKKYLNKFSEKKKKSALGTSIFDFKNSENISNI